MLWRNLLCGSLCAFGYGRGDWEKPALARPVFRNPNLSSPVLNIPVVEKVIETHIWRVEKPVTTTVTSTVVQTVGVVATEVSMPPSYIRPRPRKRPEPFDYSYYLSIPRALVGHTVLDIAPLLYSAGQWLSEPVTISFTPAHMIILFSVLATIGSFCIFFSEPFHQQYVKEVIDRLVIGFWAGSTLVWLLIFFALHNLAHGSLRKDPMDFLANRITYLEAAYPCSLVGYFSSIPTWWAPYAHRGHIFWRVLWPAIEPSVMDSASIFARRFGQAARVLPEIMDLGFTICGHLLGFLFFVAAFIYIGLKWLYDTWVYGPLIMFYYVFLRLSRRTYPAAIISWLNRPYQIPDYFTQDMEDYAANMTLQQRIDLIVKNNTLRQELRHFNEKVVTRLGKRCVEYRFSVQALIKEANYLRTILDMFTTYQWHIDRGIPLNIGNEALYRFHTARIDFCPDPEPNGYHFKIDNFSRPLKPSQKLPLKTLRMADGKFRVPTLFWNAQHEAWDLGTKMPGVAFPEYDLRPETVDITDKKMKMLVEDFAAMGKGLELMEGF